MGSLGTMVRNRKARKEIEAVEEKEMADGQRKSVGYKMKTNTHGLGWPMPSAERRLARASRYTVPYVFRLVNIGISLAFA